MTDGADPREVAAKARDTLATQPDDEAALRRLGAACAQLQQWHEVARISERLSRVATTERERMTWQVRYAQLCAERLGRKTDAAEVLLALGAEAMAFPEIARDVVELWEHALGQTDRAFLVGMQAFAAGVDREGLAPVLERLALETDSVDELAEVLEAAADELLPGDPRCAPLVRRAALLRERAQPQEAIKLWNDVLAELPADAEALAHLTELYASSGDPKRLAEVVSRRAEHMAEPTAKAALFVRLGAVQETAGEDDGAIDSYRTALALEPSVQGLSGLERLYGRARRYDEQVEVLQRLAQAAGGPDDIRAALVRRADVLAAAGHLDTAVSAYAQVLERWPQEASAVAGLERQFRAPSVQAQVASALEPVYRARGDRSKLADTLEVRAETVPARERAGVLSELAGLRESLGQADQAFAAWRRAFAADPVNPTVREGFERFAQAQGSTEDLVAAYEDQLDRTRDDALARSLWRRVAYFDERLGRWLGASKAWEEVARREPAAAEPLESLARILREHSEPGRLAQVLLRQAALPQRLDAQLDLLFQAAQIAEDTLKDLDLAAATYRKILERAPGDRNALKSLEKLARDAGRYQELADALEKDLRLAESRGEAEEALELRMERARVQLDHLEDPQAALATFETILSVNPSHPGALAAIEELARSRGPFSARAAQVLEPLLQRSGQHSRLAEVLGAHAAVAATADERVALLLEAADVQAGSLGDASGALVAAAGALRANPDDARLLDKTLQLAARANADEELGALLDEIAPTAKSPEARVRLGLWLGRTQEKLGDPESAIVAWRRLLGEVPLHLEALDRLEHLLEGAKRHAELLDLLDRKLAQASSAEERFEICKRTARVQELAGQQSAAIDTLRAAFEQRPDVEVLTALDRLLGAAGRHLEKAEVLRQLAALATDPESKRQAWVRCGDALVLGARPDVAADAYAEALRQKFGDAAAVAGLEQVLASPSAKKTAASALEPVYRAWNDARKLAGVLDVRLGAADGPERASLLAEISELRESLGEKALGFAARLVSFAENPENETTRAELERLGYATGLFAELAEEYRVQLDRGLSAPLEAELWRKLALLYDGPLPRADLAAAAWNQVLTRDPRNAEALSALARKHQETGDGEALLRVMTRQLELEPSLDGQVALLMQIAQLADERLADPARAVEACRGVLSRRPHHADATAYLESLLEESGRTAELIGFFEERIRAAEDAADAEGAIALKTRVAQMTQDEPERALPLLREVLGLRPGYPAAVLILERMMREGSPARADAAALLEPLYALRGEHAKLAAALGARADAESRPAERAALLHRLTELHAGPLWNPAAAFSAAAKSLREVPGDARALQDCLAWHEVAGATAELATLLVEVGPAVEEPRARVAVFRALGRIEEQRGRASDATEAWRQVLAQEPEDLEALEVFAGLLERQGRWAELLEARRRQLAMARTPDRQARLLEEVAALQQDRTDDGAGALESLRALLALRPEDPLALERLDHLSEAQGLFPELERTLERRLHLASPDKRRPLQLRLAQLRESKLAKRPAALEVYADVLREDPRCAEAIEQLEAIANREAKDVAVADLLLGAYRQNGERPKLAALLDARASLSSNWSERKALWIELAQLRSELGELEPAFLALARAFREEPNDVGLAEWLEQLADQAGLYEELANVYEQVLPEILDASRASTFCLKLGLVHEQHLRDLRGAVIWFEESRAKHASAQDPALEALARVFEGLEQWGDMAEALESQAARAPTAATRVPFLARLAQVSEERLGAPERAIAAHEKVLELDPTQVPAARALSRLYGAAGEHERQLGALDRLRELTHGPERESALLQMAKVCLEGLKDDARGIELCRTLLRENPRSEPGFDVLASVLERTAKHVELKDLLQARLSWTFDPHALAVLHERLGNLIWRSLGDVREAVPHFQAALARERTPAVLECLREAYEELSLFAELADVLRQIASKAARLRLAELVASNRAKPRKEGEALEMARRALGEGPHLDSEHQRFLDVFLALGAFADAVSVLEQRAEALLEHGDRAGATEALFTVAELRGRQDKPLEVAKALETILRIDPASRAAYDDAQALYQRLAEWRSYVRLALRFLPHWKTDAERQAALAEVARVQEEQVGDGLAAFQTLCQAFRLGPADEALLERLLALGGRTRSHQELTRTLQQVTDQLPRGELAVRRYLTLARLYEERLREDAGAKAAFERVLEIDPTHDGAFDGLAKLHARRGDYAACVTVLERKRELKGSVDVRVEIDREIARVQEEGLKNPEAAAAALGRALDARPGMDTVLPLVELRRRYGHWGELVRTLLVARDLAPTAEERVRLQLEVAGLQESELEEDEAAIQAYQRVLELDGSNRQALEALERLYTTVESFGDVGRILERRLELAGDVPERIALHFQAAELKADHLGDAPGARASLGHVLELDPRNARALDLLARSLSADKRWLEWVAVYTRVADLKTGRAEQAEVHAAIAEVAATQLGDVERAAKSYHRALELDPKNPALPRALAELYAGRGQWPRVLEMLQREAGLIRKSEAAAIYQRMGDIHLSKLSDPKGAKANYLQALDAEAGHLLSIRALGQIYAKERDWAGYERMLIAEAEHTRAPEPKREALLRVAKHFVERKQDEVAARTWFEAVLGVAPESLEAAAPLAEMAIKRGDGPTAERMLEILARRATERAATHERAAQVEAARQLQRLAQARVRNGKKESALEAYERAAKLDPEALPIHEEQAALLLDSKRQPEALAAYQRILVQHAAQLSNAAAAALRCQVGEIHLALGQPQQAQSQFERALVLVAGHERALRGLVRLADEAKDYPRAAEHRRQLMRAVALPAKFQVAVELGDLSRERLGNPLSAIEAYAQALKVKPDALPVLESLCKAYRSAGQGERAAQTVRSILAHPEVSQDPERKKHALLTLGEISSHDLKDPDAGLEHFEAALDLDYRFVEAFNAMESILASTKRWRRLDDAYARMIKRVPEREDTLAVRMSLWRAVGDLRAKGLKDPPGALVAYRTAADGLPDDAVLQEALGQFAAALPGHEQTALTAFRRALPRATDPVPICAALARLASKMRDAELGYWADQVLTHLLAQAPSSERPAPLEKPLRGLSPRLWRERVAHPSVRGLLGEILDVLFDQGARHWASTPGTYGLNPKKHLLDRRAAAQNPALGELATVAALLGIEPPEVYSLYVAAMREGPQRPGPIPDVDLDVELCWTAPVSLKVGGRFFNAWGAPQLRARLGFCLAFTRSGLALARWFPPERLELMVQAAVTLFHESFRALGDPRELKKERKRIDKALSTSARLALQNLTLQYTAVARPGDVARFVEGAELTALRVGLLAASEVRPLLDAVVDRRGLLVAVSRDRAMRDLIQFALGGELEAVRAQLKSPERRATNPLVDASEADTDAMTLPKNGIH